MDHGLLQYHSSLQRGGANGFNWNIRYWTIWEEPENKSLWNTEPIQYFRLFKLTVERFKKRFPNLKFGTCVGNHLSERWGADLLSYCRAEKVSMDFFGWSCYVDDLVKVIRWPEEIRALVDSYGFEDVELHIAEWNYTNYEQGFGYCGKDAAEHPEGCYGYTAAAFAAAVLTGWQDTSLTMANYYTQRANGTVRSIRHAKEKLLRTAGFRRDRQARAACRRRFRHRRREDTRGA